MSKLSKKERVMALLKDGVSDRVPVSAWRHFIKEETDMDALSEITINFTDQFDWDWIKVNPRATYLAEAFGNEYDFSDYEGVFPRLVKSRVGEIPDLTRIRPVKGYDGVLGEHLMLLKKVKKGAGGIPFIQTVFSPLSVLGFILARNKNHSQKESAASQLEQIKWIINNQPEETLLALEIISTSLAEYASETLNAGANGLFFAIVGLAREGALNKDEYKKFAEPFDLKVLEAVKDGSFNLVHVCGEKIFMELFRNYPVHAVNWACRSEGNPGIYEAGKMFGGVLLSGLDEKNTLMKGTPMVVESEAEKALFEGRGNKFMLTPGCAVDVNTPVENLKALRMSVDK